MANLRLVPLDDVVVLPGMPIAVSFDLGDDSRVLLISKRHNVFAKIGIVAEVTERPARRRRGTYSLVALHRAVPGEARTDPVGGRPLEGAERPDATTPSDDQLEQEAERHA